MAKRLFQVLQQEWLQKSIIERAPWAPTTEIEDETGKFAPSKDDQSKQTSLEEIDEQYDEFSDADPDSMTTECSQAYLLDFEKA